MVFASFLLVSCDRPQPKEKSTPTPAQGRSLSVAFWNLNWFPGRHPHARADAQASHVAAAVPVVAQLDVDVIGFEEIAGREAIAPLVAALSGFKVDVCSEFLRGPEQKRSHSGQFEPEADDGAPWTLPDRQQVALCSRLLVLETGAQPWRAGPEGPRQRRGFVWAAYRTGPGEAVLVYGTHLKSNVLDVVGGEAANRALREAAGRHLLAHVRAAIAAWNRPEQLRLAVIGGDMNTSFDDAPYRDETTLRDWTGPGGFFWGWDGVPLARRLTMPAKGHYPPTCFDHIFYQPRGGPVRVVSAAVVASGLDASDHRPITVHFAW